jgi:hypothetical protein
MTTKIEFEVRGIRELQARLNRGDPQMRIILNEGLRAIGRLFVPSKGTGPLARETPKRTGKLARSTFFMITGSTRHQQLIIMQPARSEDGEFYGEFVREGTGIYGPRGERIKPKTKKALAWGADLGGGKKEFVFASVAGQKPNPYHRRVLAQNKGRVQLIVNQMGRKVTGYISGKGG